MAEKGKKSLAERFQGLKIEYNGYPQKVKLTFEGEDGVVLSGDGKYRVLLLGNQVDLTLRNLEVADGYNSLESGAGISVAAGSTGDALLTLNNVTFTNNKTTTEQSGGALRCAKGKIVASDCLFDASNCSRNGASIMTNNPQAEVLFTSCTFLSHSSNTGGAANNSKGKQTFRNCICKGCYTVLYNVQISKGFASILYQANVVQNLAMIQIPSSMVIQDIVVDTTIDKIILGCHLRQFCFGI